MRSRVGRLLRLSVNAEHAIRVMSAEGDTRLETGGALFGFDDGTQVAVTAVCGPGPKAIRAPQYFLRDLAHTRVAAKELHASSGAQWIGEWHTHPRGPNGPSDRDLHTYASHLFDSELGFEAFLSIIARTAPQPELVSLYPWMLEKFGDDAILYPPRSTDGSQ